jgi:hypothetical protein
MLTKEFLYDAMKGHRLAVLATAAPSGRVYRPQAAVVGIAISPELEIVFDTVRSSRKYGNLLANPGTAWVIGWDNETTIQYEGIARELGSTANDDRYRDIYYEAWPDGRDRLVTMAQLTHFVVSPVWIRYSNYLPPVRIEEFSCNL